MLRALQLLFDSNDAITSEDAPKALRDLFESVVVDKNKKAFICTNSNFNEKFFNQIDCKGGSLPSRLPEQGSKLLLVAVQDCTFVDDEIFLGDQLYRLCGTITRRDADFKTHILKSGICYSYTGTSQIAPCSDNLRNINFDTLYSNVRIKVLLYTRCELTMEVIESNAALQGYSAKTLLCDDPGLPWLLPEEVEFGKISIVFSPPTVLSILTIKNHRSSKIVVLLKSDVEHRVELNFSSVSEEKQLRDLQHIGCVRRLNLVAHGDTNFPGPFGLDRMFILKEGGPTHGVAAAAPVVAVSTEMCRDSNNNDKLSDARDANDCGSDSMAVSPEGSYTTNSKRDSSPGLTTASKRSKSSSSLQTVPITIVKLSEMNDEFFEGKVVLISSSLRDVPRLSKAATELGGIVKTKGFYRLYDVYIGEIDDSPELQHIVGSNCLKKMTRLVYPELLMHVYQRKFERSQPDD